MFENFNFRSLWIFFKYLYWNIDENDDFDFLGQGNDTNSSSQVLGEAATADRKQLSSDCHISESHAWQKSVGKITTYSSILPQLLFRLVSGLIFKTI